MIGPKKGYIKNILILKTSCLELKDIITCIHWQVNKAQLYHKLTKLSDLASHLLNLNYSKGEDCKKLSPGALNHNYIKVYS